MIYIYNKPNCLFGYYLAKIEYISLHFKTIIYVYSLSNFISDLDALRPAEVKMNASKFTVFFNKDL